MNRRPRAWWTTAIGGAVVCAAAPGLAAQEFSVETECVVVGDGAVTKVGYIVSYGTPDFPTTYEPTFPLDRSIVIGRNGPAEGRAPCDPRDILPLGGSGSTIGPDAGTAFPEGTLLADWNDSGAYLPALGVSTGIPVPVGHVAPGIWAGGDVRTLVVAFAGQDLSSGVAHLTAPRDPGTTGSAVSSTVDRAARAGPEVDPGPSARLQPLERMSAFSLSQVDSTGDSSRELRCERPRAVVLSVPDDRVGRTVPGAARGSGPGAVELLVVTCAGGFDVY